MKHFLVVFDRREGRLLNLKEYPTSAAALQARFDTEKSHRREHAVEVVVLTAPTETDLRRTHARYFKDVRQLASNGLDRVAKVQQTAGWGSGAADPMAV